MNRKKWLKKHPRPKVEFKYPEGINTEFNNDDFSDWADSAQERLSDNYTHVQTRTFEFGQPNPNGDVILGDIINEPPASYPTLGLRVRQRRASMHYVVVEYLENNMLGLVSEGQLGDYYNGDVDAEVFSLSFYMENFTEASTQMGPHHRPTDRPGDRFIYNTGETYTLNSITLLNGTVYYNLTSSRGEGGHWRSDEFGNAFAPVNLRSNEVRPGEFQGMSTQRIQRNNRYF